VVFQTDQSVGAHGAAGVRVAAVETDDAEPRLKYQPDIPTPSRKAPTRATWRFRRRHDTEFTDALEAARSYEANLGAMDISKDMQNQTLRILA